MKIKKLLISIFIPLILGAIVGFITFNYNNYSNFILPNFAPPGIIFPIVWTILYILMGISSYIVSESNSLFHRKALSLYKIQLVVNLLWTFIFFVFNLKTLALLWIILLIFLVISMIEIFYLISKKAALIQLPYLLWLVFAAFLNLSIILLN